MESILTRTLAKARESPEGSTPGNIWAPAKRGINEKQTSVKSLLILFIAIGFFVLVYKDIKRYLYTLFAGRQSFC
jgi:hypothetical protein